MAGLLELPVGEAQQRVMLPAPASGTTVQPGAKRAIAASSAEVEKLERQWEGIRAHRAEQTFAQAAASLCLKASALATEEEGRPGPEAAVVESACPAALTAVLECHGETSTATDSWTVGFERPAALARDAACGSADVLFELATLARQHQWPTDTDTISRILADESFAKLAAAAGHRALALSECERIKALQAIVRSAPKAKGPDEALLNSSSNDQLTQNWAQLSARQIRYADVAAYHLTETRLALYENGLLAATSPMSSTDLTALDHAQRTLKCLRGYRDAKDLRSAVRDKIKIGRTALAKEDACQKSRTCMAKRQGLIRQPERVERDVQAASDECCGER
jgi:hypothetical protein